MDCRLKRSQSYFSVPDHNNARNNVVKDYLSFGISDLKLRNLCLAGFEK